MAKSSAAATAYDEHSIKVLKGLEPVQQRPGMYTRTDHPNHIIQEVVDNAQDEALAGFAKNITVTAHEDGSVSVQDDGRGIPTAIHPDEGVSTVEVVFTRLHAGGKFDKGKGNAYSFTGGLHGVGVSVTNALSSRLEVTVWRDGYEHRLAFAHGLVVEPLTRKKLPAEEKGRTGTRVHAWPEAKYFDSATIQMAEMERLLRAKAVLMPGTRLVFERHGKQPLEWHYPGGIAQYLQEGVGEQGQWLTPIFQVSLAHQGENPEDNQGFAQGEGFDLAMGWLEEGRATRESFVNLIPTIDGGTHESGLRSGVLDAVRKFAERLNLIPKGVKLEADDVAGKAAFVLSLKMLDPQFQGQTKDRLNSKDAVKLVSGMLRDSLELWLNDHLDDAKKIVEMAVQEAVRRTKASNQTERRKGSSATVLPGKLSDCEDKDVDRTELFLVEGDSAGGSAKMGRDRKTQAILPLRGKVLNTWEIDPDKLFSNNEVHDIAVALGVEPHTGKRAAEVDLSRLRYGRVCIMADADVDGQHIQVLLLTLFYKHFPALIETRRVWIAQSPLFRVDAPPKRKGGGSKDRRKLYALDEKELGEIERELVKEGLSENHWTVSRFKGLGEMNAEQLWDTTMNPDTRRMLMVSLDDVTSLDAVNGFEMMMAKRNSKMRQDWMEKDGASVEADT